jgi:hypothetical protein
MAKNSITYTRPEYYTRNIFSNNVYKGYAYKNTSGNWILHLDGWGRAGIYDNLPQLKSWIASALDGVEKHKKVKVEAEAKLKKEKEEQSKKDTYTKKDVYPKFEYDGYIAKVTTQNGNTCTRRYVEDIDTFARYTEKGYIGSGTPRKVGDFKL